MIKGDKAGIVCCSNGLSAERKEDVQKLVSALTKIGITPVMSEYIYTRSAVFSGTGEKHPLDHLKNDEITEKREK